MKSWSVVTSEGEEEEIGGDTNANTSGFEMTIGQDINTETIYSRMLIRFAGDISIDLTTLQGPEGTEVAAFGTWQFRAIWQFRC